MCERRVRRQRVQHEGTKLNEDARRVPGCLRQTAADPREARRDRPFVRLRLSSFLRL